MRKKDSFRWKIFIYNVILLTMVAVVCTMYFLLNDKTITTYNQTFTTYNELNHYYSDVKEMNTSYKSYLENRQDEDFEHFTTSRGKALEALSNITSSIENKEHKKRFKKLYNMIDSYPKERKILDQEVVTTKAHDTYLSIMKTRSDYYNFVSEDMQQYKDNVNKNREYLGLLSIWMIIFMILWIIYFSIAMLRSITKPIESIIHNIKQIKMGTYDLTQISNTNEEMNVLCLALEDMADSVQKNIQYTQEKAELEKRFLEQQNEILKKDERLAQGELRILQNQINPHFLFNTLNMIYKKAYSEEAYETVELMEKTSQVLRYSLDNANKISTLREEIKAVKNYMFIQEKRFDDRIQFIIEVDEQLPLLTIPTMILQPLVENAVQHGLHDKIDMGEVNVSITWEDEDVIISVGDNGKGMREKELETLILNEYRICDDEREHIGLYNVTKRLLSFYGNRVKIVLNSAEDCGFEIIIRITLKGE